MYETFAPFGVLFFGGGGEERYIDSDVNDRDVDFDKLIKKFRYRRGRGFAL